jgi:hypothetical protein
MPAVILHRIDRFGTPARAFGRSGFTLGNIAAVTDDKPIGRIIDTHNREIVFGNHGSLD